jgi:hypothetical protein
MNDNAVEGVICQSDGHTVWVNGPANCLARFTQHGFEIFTQMTEKVTGGTITSTRAGEDGMGLNEWNQFRGLVNLHHGYDIPSNKRPTWLNA